jgi:integrase
MELLTVEKLIILKHESMRRLVNAGKMTGGAKAKYAAASKVLNETKLLDRYVEDLQPEDFSVLFAYINSMKLALSTKAALIIRIKAIFNWGFMMGYYPAVSYGPDFKGASPLEIEAEREAKGRIRFIDREVILKALDKCEVDKQHELKIAILLGINCGFYAIDSAGMRLVDVEWDAKTDSGFVKMRRSKTCRPRRCALWPETLKAIGIYCNESRQNRIIGEHHGAADTILTRRDGRPFASGRVLAKKFKELLKVITGSNNDGVGLGSLRHTYATIIDRFPDQSIIDLTMGHAPSSLQKRAYRQINLEEDSRLRELSEVVRAWLYHGVTMAK